MFRSGRKRHWSRWLYRTQWTLLAIIALAVAALRLDLIRYQAAFEVFKYAGLAAVAVALVSILVFIWGLVTRHPKARKAALLATALGVIPVAIPLFSVGEHNFGAPPIHDISTDLKDPPAFEAVVSLRNPGDNSPDYPGDAVASQQRDAPLYGDIRPLQLNMTVAEATELADTVAQRLGWRVVAKSPRKGRLEAVARTPILGFTEDVVVRVKKEGQGVKVDIRSASRTRTADLGSNGQRIRVFLKEMKSRAGQR
ncbi:DUF1499 domain-containing protein [Microbulbifer pacificus]|uniref:DUF1499 domain-containing protein n=1 Tax=Microbulbifer pacificus TaxID=407164 RepID=UPI000CF4524F|nr:DUF1499 domain-containing protein [Microbulbifer pacificus]